MAKYRNLDTGEIWTEEEVKQQFEMFRDELPEQTFEEYLENLLEMGQQKTGGLIPVKVWYAIQKSSTDAWDNGTFDIEEAKEMLKEQGHGLIAVIDEEHNFCVEEIKYKDII